MDRITAAHVFVAIHERGSLAAAATALDMSRAMVTRYLAQMEDWTGARLLHRTTRKLGLTAAGAGALLHCRELLAIAEQMPVANPGTAEEVRGSLRIACSQPLAQEVLATAVAEFLRRHPLTTIDLQIGSHSVNLVEERIDLAIRITNQLDPNLLARPLGHCASVICASPAYLAAHGTPKTPQDLAMHNCVTYTHFGKSLWEFNAGPRRVAVPVGGNLSANETAVLLAAIVEGVGIGHQPLHAAAPFIASGRLVALLPGDRPQDLGIHGIYTSRRHMPASLRAMLDFLAEWFARDPQWAAPPAPR